jgi:hypothetical protein
MLQSDSTIVSSETEANLLAALVRESATASKPSVSKPFATSTSAVSVSQQKEGSVSLTATSAPLLPVVGKHNYSHQRMVDLILERPDYSYAQLAAHFERPQSWLSSVLASEGFQQCLDPVRHQVADPRLSATLRERFQALAISTTNVLMNRMDNPDVGDFVLVKSSEIAIKALGMGQKGVEQPAAPSAPPPTSDQLAAKILAMMDKQASGNTIDAEIVEVKEQSSG